MKKFLICTDGSPYSQVCCEYAASLARQNQAIDVLYLTDIRQFEMPLVADLSGSLGISPYSDVMNQLQELEKTKAKFIEESTLNLFKKHDMEQSVKFHHRTGLLVDCLDDFESSVDLVMCGKRGEDANFATEHLGSTMERVLRASKKPCLITSRAFSPIKKMVIAFDGGQSCRKAVEWLANSDLLKNVELHIVTVGEEHTEDEARKRLEWAEQMFSDSDFNPVCQMLGGVVEEAITHYVENEGMDLLVMGAYGHNRIRYLLIGSTTTAMIRSCHIPVLCFR